jgi:hypothetical protein
MGTMKYDHTRRPVTLIMISLSGLECKINYNIEGMLVRMNGS